MPKGAAGACGQPRQSHRRAGEHARISDCLRGIVVNVLNCRASKIWRADADNQARWRTEKPCLNIRRPTKLGVLFLCCAEQFWGTGASTSRTKKIRAPLDVRACKALGYIHNLTTHRTRAHNPARRT